MGDYTVSLWKRVKCYFHQHSWAYFAGKAYRPDGKEFKIHIIMCENCKRKTWDFVNEY